MFSLFKQRASSMQVRQLLDADPITNTMEQAVASKKTMTRVSARELSPVSRQLYYAGLPIVPKLFILVTICFSLFFIGLLNPFVPAAALPIIGIIAAGVPLQWVWRRIEDRVKQFSEDYPTLLLATASSISAGHTAELALERATKLMTSESLVRKEVEKMMERSRKGEARESAVAAFGDSIQLPDLELFRAAFLLATENGGRFAPTLQRLAVVTRDRLTLINAAKVSTASMRMTGRILLLMTPIIIGMVSVRSESYWTTLLEHPTANSIASTGTLMIVLGFLFLRQLSAFRP